MKSLRVWVLPRLQFACNSAVAMITIVLLTSVWMAAWSGAPAAEAAPSTSCQGFSCAPYEVCEVGPRGPQCICSTACPLLYSPVCGTDGVLYANECTLKVKTCQTFGVVRKSLRNNCGERAAAITHGQPVSVSSTSSTTTSTRQRS